MIINIKKSFAIFCAKFIKFICNIFGKPGMTLPGKISLLIYPNILNEIAKQIKKNIFVICGTNGKTTVTNLLYTIIKENKYNVICNNTGANMLNGITSTFVLNSDIYGNINIDYACIEVDEASTIKVFKYLQPNYMILTNLFRDQLDRYGEIDIVIKIILNAIKLTPNIKIIFNEDDPLSKFLVNNINNNSCNISYGINDKIKKQNINEIRECYFCPYCKNKMNYKFYHYSQLGNYSCTKCNFFHNIPKFNANNIKIINNHLFFLINNKFNINIYKYNGFYNIYNILSVYSAIYISNITFNNFNKILNNYSTKFGRNEIFNINNTKITLNLAKNPSSFNQNINTLFLDTTLKSIIIIINDNYQDGKDISWLWDVSFEEIIRSNIISITSSGIRYLDLFLRLKYAGIYSIIETNIIKAIKFHIKNKTKNLYLFTNYSAAYKLHNILKKMSKGTKI